MDRRQFIKTSLISGVSLFLLPNFLKASVIESAEVVESDIFDYSMPYKDVQQFHVNWKLESLKSTKGSKEFESNFMEPAIASLQQYYISHIRKGYKSKYIAIPKHIYKGEHFIKNGVKLRYLEAYDINWDCIVARIDLLMVKV
jgi:hypothetical protein